MPFVEREVILRNGPPWGFRLVDNHPGLSIARIRKNSPAEEAGLHESDVLVAINNLPAKDISHSRAVEIIDFAAFVLTLTVGRHESRVVETFTISTPSAAPLETESSASVRLDYLPGSDEPIVIPASPDVQPMAISKLQQPATDTPISPPNTKRNFADSSFYHDKENYYPTIEEQIGMAKKVAESLTDHMNLSSKGAAMFEKRRQRSTKWMTGQEDSDKSESEEETQTNQEVQMAFPVMYGADLETTIPEDAPPPIPPPPPLPPAPGYPGLIPERGTHGKIPPPPPPPPGAPRSEQEFLEKLKAYPRSKHNTVAPQQCFDIASALHSSNSRGAQIFAKRRQRAHKWDRDSTEDDDDDVSQPQPVLAKQPGPYRQQQQPGAIQSGGGGSVAVVKQQPIMMISSPIQKVTTTATAPSVVIQTKAKLPSKLTRPSDADQKTAISKTEENTNGAGAWRPVKFSLPQETISSTPSTPTPVTPSPGSITVVTPNLTDEEVLLSPTSPSADAANSTTSGGWRPVHFSIPQSQRTNTG